MTCAEGRFGCCALISLAVLACQSPAPESLRHIRTDDLGAAGEYLTQCEDRTDDQPCFGLVYIWTPGMGLSRVAIDSVLTVAETLDVPLAIVTLESLGLAEPTSEVPALAGSLVRAGAGLHAPALVVTRDGHPVGGAILGFKSVGSYVELVSTRMAGRDTLHSPSGGFQPRKSDAHRPLRTNPLLDLPPPVPGFFYRHVPNTEVMTFDHDSSVFLLDISDGTVARGPGWIDLVPSPDGKLLVTPGQEGLLFYTADAVTSAVAEGRGASLQPLFVDSLMTDQYPSIGVVAPMGVDSATHYRIVTSWREGIAVRDYRVSYNGLGSVEPISSRRTACPGKWISTPIVSPDGTELSARDETSATTVVLSLPDSEGMGCELVLDLGVGTSKASFSPDGSKLAFSMQHGQGRESRWHVYVFDRISGTTQPVPGATSRGLVIPEFRGHHALLTLRIDRRGSSSAFVESCCLTYHR